MKPAILDKHVMTETVDKNANSYRRNTIAVLFGVETMLPDTNKNAQGNVYLQ